MLTCYVLVRYLPRTMNPGKAMAQVHHAGTHLVQYFNGNPDLDEWLNQGDSFGTVIVLTPKDKTDNLLQLQEIVKHAHANGLCAGIVVDPTYPLDHELTAQVTTCGYILVDSESKVYLREIIKENWELHP